MYGEHLVNQLHAKPPLVTSNILHVIGVITNPARVHSRIRLFRDWYAKMQATPNVEVYVVEAAFGDRAHEITECGNPKHLQLRTSSEIWVKENLMNLGVRHLLPRDWRYVCFSDCDITFRDDTWATEAMQQAQHFAVLQPWQSCADLGPLGNITQNFSSFGYLSQAGIKMQVSPLENYPYGHSGFAWAMRREQWEATQGLLDFAILGSADHHMAWAFVGKAVANSVHAGMSQDFKNRVQRWQDLATPVSKYQVGFAPGRIEHSFHGPKKKRYYRERWQILVQHDFQPTRDLRYDAAGVLQLVGKPELEAAIRAYNRSREEDSTSE